MPLGVAQVCANATTAGAGASISATFGSATTTGSLIVVPIPAYNPPAWTSTFWFDNKSNVFSSLDNTGATVSEHCGVGYENGGTRGSSHQITFDPTGSGMSSDLGGIEYTGHDATTPFATSCTGKANDTTSPFNVTAGAAFPTNASGIYICSIGGASGSPAIGSPSGYTQVMAQSNADTSMVGYVGYKLAESGTPTVGCTWTGTVGSESPREMIIAVQEASGGGPTGQPMSLRTGFIPHMRAGSALGRKY